MEWIDSHAHLDDPSIAGELEAVAAAARASGVVSVVSVGTDAASWDATLALAQRWPACRVALAIHPNELSSAAGNDFARLTELARDPRVVAVGETGIDLYHKRTSLEDQQAAFRRHIALARELDLPFVVHCREAEAEVLAILRAEAAAGGKPLCGVMHSFDASAAMASECLELGMHISFSGMVTFRNRRFEALREVARQIPLARLLVETDAPYLAPEPVRGQPNRPQHVVHTGTLLAQIRGEPVADLAAATTANARHLFRLTNADNPVSDRPLAG